MRALKPKKPACAGFNYRLQLQTSTAGFNDQRLKTRKKLRQFSLNEGKNFVVLSLKGSDVLGQRIDLLLEGCNFC